MVSSSIGYRSKSKRSTATSKHVLVDLVTEGRSLTYLMRTRNNFLDANRLKLYGGVGGQGRQKEYILHVLN